MKKMMKTLLAVLMMGALCSNSYAQRNEERNAPHERREHPQTEQRERLSPEQRAERQAQRIARELALDDATQQRFIETFCRYQAEKRALMPERKECKDNQGPKQPKANPTEAECKQKNEQRLAHQQQQLDLRKKYYKEYSKFLTQKQIARIDKMEMPRQGRKGEKGMMKRGKGNHFRNETQPCKNICPPKGE